MPWCEACAKYHAPTAMNDDSTCPVCGGEVGEPEQRAVQIAQDESAPWHFKLLIVMTVVYLGWRFVQLLA